MARASKKDIVAEVAAEADVAKEENITMSVQDYVKLHETFIQGLASLQSNITNLSQAYIKVTNSVLKNAGEGLSIDHLALPALNENSILGAFVNAAGGQGGAAAGDDKKERKKRQHDPNAPKRPLTPFFLYMQTARPIIANDLGPGVPKGQVSEEGTKRWKLLGDHDRGLWTDAYKVNLRYYQARVHSYKVEGNVNAKDMTDEEASEYAEWHNIDAVPDAAVSAALATENPEVVAPADEDADAEGEPEKEPTPPPVAKATPKPKAVRKGKGAKAVASVPESALEPEAIVPSPAAASIVPSKAAEEKTPAKSEKRKRVSKKDEAAAAASAEAPTPVPATTETPKPAGKSRKKKAKTDG
ncbi:high mobility group protein [Calycina marina]|uniref:High mobility group protein n=1 Tax=Calycina marina TaxID=1763456 RepID=A0A9P7ZAI1_9HELO|nr:high mobility group protein [Calycina marina]